MPESLVPDDNHTLYGGNVRGAWEDYVRWQILSLATLR